MQCFCLARSITAHRESTGWQQSGYAVLAVIVPVLLRVVLELPILEGRIVCLQFFLLTIKQTLESVFSGTIRTVVPGLPVTPKLLRFEFLSTAQ